VEQDRPDVRGKRESFAGEVEGIRVENIVALDESCVNLAYTRLYGCSRLGERVKEGVFDARFDHRSILSTVRLNGDMCPFVFKGTLNKRIFADYTETRLRLVLSAGDVFLLDDSSVHRSRLVLETLDGCGIRYLFLPPYSPDLNPIE